VLLAGAGEGSAVLLSLARLRAAAGPGPPGTTALFGAPRVQDLPFRSELAGLSAAGRLSVRLAVERPEPGWTGAVGVVPVLFRGLTLDPPATAAIVAGPDALCKFVVLELLLRGVAEEAILVVPERGPRCGADACPECERGDRYVCRRGPVFPWPEFRESPAPR
jgi:NAD(P)H-flavin reductase